MCQRIAETAAVGWDSRLAFKFEYRRPLLLYSGGGTWHHKFRKETTVKLDE